MRLQEIDEPDLEDSEDTLSLSSGKDSDGSSNSQNKIAHFLRNPEHDNSCTSSVVSNMSDFTASDDWRRLDLQPGEMKLEIESVSRTDRKSRTIINIELFALK